MVNKTLIAACAITMSTLTLSACGGSSSGSSDDGKITMGFAQVGAESGWRTANTKSIQDSANAEDVELKFSDAQQKQENQIKAIRSYIQQKVDVIAFSPVVETGWDAVLQEAKRANIPVILTDRSVDSEDGIDVVYAHNDDMGLGAIEAIEAAGLTPGKDIKIITVDAVKDGMTALADGKISFIVECNPLLGPQLMDLAQKVVDGEDVPKRVVTEETTFTQDQAKDVLADRQY